MAGINSTGMVSIMALTDITEHSVETARHMTFYLAAGPEHGTPIFFLHGWPQLSISWRHQLPAFAALGFRAIAPDMRGYGRSSTYTTQAAFAQREIVADMLELAEALKIEKAIWVGHDWGSPVVSNIASHHPERCIAVANFCTPYHTIDYSVEATIELADRTLYPADKYPAAQWEYLRFYEEKFEKASRVFEANIDNTVRALFRAGNPEGRGKPSVTASVRHTDGWFGGADAAPPAPRDPKILTEADEHAYASALKRNGFFGPDSWYMNNKANAAYAAEAKNSGYLDMPALLLEAEYDYVADCAGSRLSEPAKKYCRDFTIKRVKSGHWLMEECPAEVNAHIAQWLAARAPGVWVVK
jgi:pimeloyl-ACP methyl ester carboxylesterase